MRKITITLLIATLVINLNMAMVINNKENDKVNKPFIIYETNLDTDSFDDDLPIEYKIIEPKDKKTTNLNEEDIKKENVDILNMKKESANVELPETGNKNTNKNDNTEEVQNTKKETDKVEIPDDPKKNNNIIKNLQNDGNKIKNNQEIIDKENEKVEIPDESNKNNKIKNINEGGAKTENLKEIKKVYKNDEVSIPEYIDDNSEAASIFVGFTPKAVKTMHLRKKRGFFGSYYGCPYGYVLVQFNDMNIQRCIRSDAAQAYYYHRV